MTIYCFATNTRGATTCDRDLNENPEMTDATRKLVTILFCSTLIAHASALSSPDNAWAAEYVIVFIVHGRVCDQDNPNTGVGGIQITANLAYSYHPYMYEGEPSGYDEIRETKTVTTDAAGYFNATFEVDKWVYNIIEMSAVMQETAQWIFVTANTDKNPLFDTEVEYKFFARHIDDADGNGIHDPYEWALLQKFCPSFKANVSDPYLFPNPVQIMGGEYNTEISVTMVIDDRIKHEFYDDLNMVPIHADLIEYAGPDMKFIPIMKFGAWGRREDITKTGILNLPSNPIPLYYNDYLRIRANSAAPYDTILVADITRRHVPNNYPFASAKLYVHYDFPGSTPDLWYVNNLAHPLKSRYTIYGTLWREGNMNAIQYWFFYAYNDWKNDHEGDWEHINVLLTSQVPDLARIDKVQFYFHTRWKEWVPSKLSIDDGTHVIVYIGGSYDAGHYNGHLSNGSYPYDDEWENAGGDGDHDLVHAWGPPLRWFSITGENDQPDDGFGLELIKDTTYLINDKYFWNDNRKYGYYDWLIIDLFWGEPATNPGDNRIVYYQGPTFKAGWRSMGSSSDFSSY